MLPDVIQRICNICIFNNNNNNNNNNINNNNNYEILATPCPGLV